MRVKKTDANQQQIVDALEKIGCSVQKLHMVGEGCPDLLVGRDGINVLIECKTEDGTLNPRQRRWHAEWQGDVFVAIDPAEAVEIVIKATLNF